MIIYELTHGELDNYAVIALFASKNQAMHEWEKSMNKINLSTDGIDPSDDTLQYCVFEAYVNDKHADKIMDIDGDEVTNE